MLIFITKGVQESLFPASTCAFGKLQPSPEVANLSGGSVTSHKRCENLFLPEAMCAFGPSQPSPEVDNIRGYGVTRTGWVIVRPFSPALLMLAGATPYKHLSIFILASYMRFPYQETSIVVYRFSFLIPSLSIWVISLICWLEKG